MQQNEVILSWGNTWSYEHWHMIYTAVGLALHVVPPAQGNDGMIEHLDEGC